MARCVWALVDEDTLEHVISTRIEDARLWIFWLFEALNQQDLARVLVTMWAIWWARRRAIHDGEFQSPLSTMSFINCYLEDLSITSAYGSNTATVTDRQEDQQMDKTGYW